MYNIYTIEHICIIYIYLYEKLMKKEATNLKKNKERSVEGFGWRKGKW